MSTLSIQYNDSILAALNTSRVDFEGEARKALAVKMFEIGRLTSGQASVMAGVSRVDFLLDCHRLGAFSVQWDDEELASTIGIKAPVTRETVDKYTEDVAVDGSLIQRELGFVPQYDLKTGWEETIQEIS